MKDSDAMDMTDTMFSPSGSARMYAFLLKLRPLQPGTLMPFVGEMVHAAFLNWLRATAPDVATWLHEGQKRRLFTCSNLHYSPSMQPQLRAERENIHLPLDPEKTYTVRITLLLGELFPLFHRALMEFHTRSNAAAPPFMQLSKQLFLLEEVTLATDDTSGWTDFATLADLVERAKQARFGHNPALTLEFASLTTFSRGSAKVGYGGYHALFPLPEMVFQNLLKRWEDIAPPELAGVVQRERLEQYLQENGVIVIDYNLKAHHIHFTTHLLRGFLGTCTYQLRGSDEKTTPEAPLTVRQQIYLLAQLAFYSGIGYKTAMGLGQARLLKKARD